MSNKQTCFSLLSLDQLLTYYYLRNKIQEVVPGSNFSPFMKKFKVHSEAHEKEQNLPDFSSLLTCSPSLWQNANSCKTKHTLKVENQRNCYLSHLSDTERNCYLYRLISPYQINNYLDSDAYSKKENKESMLIEYECTNTKHLTQTKMHENL